MSKKFKIKTVISFIIINALVFCLFIPVSALESNGEKSDVYVEKGQIMLEDLDLTYNESTDNLYVNEKVKSVSSEIEKDRLINAIDSSPELYNGLKQIVKENDNKLQAISYSRIFFEDEKNIFDQSPMTISEYDAATLRASINNGTPTKSLGGNFTLYTAAYVDQYTKQLFGQTHGTYQMTKVSPSENPNTFYDYVSVTLPSVYMLRSSAIYTNVVNSYKTYESDNGVAYRVKLWNGYGDVYNKVMLSASGTSSASMTGRKVISSYMHTWTTVTPSFSISATSGISISGSPSSSCWTLASSVILTC